MQINARPDKEDHQDLPKSMRIMMAAREGIKDGGNNKQRNRKQKTPEEKVL